jgi:hypothetical protein
MNAAVNESEWAALIQLIDDPDEEIFQAVSQRIAACGLSVLPQLEQIWETAEHPEHQNRLDALIRRIQFEDIQKQFDLWRLQELPDLWSGLLILDQLNHREDRSDALCTSLEQLRRNAWLELNQYLTPLEQINVLSRVLFEHNSFKGIDPVREKIENYFLGDVLLKRTGNQMGLGLLLLVLAEKLDLPLHAMQVPGLFVLGSPNILPSRQRTGIESIDFYVDPQTGELFGRVEIEQFLRRVHQPLEDVYFSPLTNPELIGVWLKKLQQKAEENGDKSLVDQIQELVNSL